MTNPSRHQLTSSTTSLLTGGASSSSPTPSSSSSSRRSSTASNSNNNMNHQQTRTSSPPADSSPTSSIRYKLNWTPALETTFFKSFINHRTGVCYKPVGMLLLLCQRVSYFISNRLKYDNYVRSKQALPHVVGVPPVCEGDRLQRRHRSPLGQTRGILRSGRTRTSLYMQICNFKQSTLTNSNSH
jgi:hypothetical protein